MGEGGEGGFESITTLPYTDVVIKKNMNSIIAIPLFKPSLLKVLLPVHFYLPNLDISVLSVPTQCAKISLPKVNHSTTAWQPFAT